jgi:hypothetical protein
MRGAPDRSGGDKRCTRSGDDGRGQIGVALIGEANGHGVHGVNRQGHLGAPGARWLIRLVMRGVGWLV